MNSCLTLPTQTHFAANLFNLPLKTASSTKGIYTEDELHAVLTLIYLATFLDIDPVKSFPLKQATKTVSEQLGKIVQTSIGGSHGAGTNSVSAHGADILKNLSKTGSSASDIAWHHVLPTAVAAIPTQGAAVSPTILSSPFLKLAYRTDTSPARSSY